MKTLSITSKLVITSVLNLFLCFSTVFAQKTPALNAVSLVDSLHFITASSNGQSSVVFHPGFNKYYSCRGGNLTFPMETWTSTGSPLFQTTAGIDTRGMWWNPYTNQVERNCFSSIGWATVNLDAGGNALNTFSMLFTGQNQPNVQSVAAYDFKTNTVLFFDAGLLHIYNRNTGTLINTMALTGISLANVNNNSVIYTGENGFEIGLLDFVAKKVLLFNRNTGVFAASVQLPASAVTNLQFRFSYANNRVWLFNSTLRTWNSFNIWNITLPIQLLSFSAHAEESTTVNCSWSTASEENNDYFTLERSKNGIDFISVAVVSGAGNSTVKSEYNFIDENPFSGVSYYRLKQTDFDGHFTYSKITSIQRNQVDIKVYTILANSDFKFELKNEDSKNDNAVFTLISAEGKVCLQSYLQNENGSSSISISRTGFKNGIYFYRIDNTSGEKLATGKLIFQ